MSEGTKVTLGTKEYYLIKNGMAQASQMSELAKWLAKHGMPIFEALTDRSEKAAKENEENEKRTSTTDLFMIILDHVTPEALIDLFSVIVGCTRKMSEKYFDVGILMDATMVVWDNQPGIRRLVNRFFSTTDSSSPMGE
jgi:hypothetical protein